MASRMRWRRFVLQYRGQGQSGQAIELFQITPHVTETVGNLWFCALSLQSRFLTASRRLEQLVLFYLPLCMQVFFIVDDVKLAELSNNSFE